MASGGAVLALAADAAAPSAAPATAENGASAAQRMPTIGRPSSASPAAPATQALTAFGPFVGSPALQQMVHLGVYLQDCDDDSRQSEMMQCLQALPHQTLMHAAQNLKKRAFWLDAEEACEFERAKELNVLSKQSATGAAEQTSGETPSLSDGFGR